MATKTQSKRTPHIRREQPVKKVRTREQKHAEKSPLRELFLSIAARGQEIPEEERAAIPKDLARNHEHYLYGQPKQSH